MKRGRVEKGGKGRRGEEEEGGERERCY